VLYRAVVPLPDPPQFADSILTDVTRRRCMSPVLLDEPDVPATPDELLRELRRAGRDDAGTIMPLTSTC